MARKLQMNIDDESDEVRIKALYDHQQQLDNPTPPEMPEPEPVPPFSDEEMRAIRWVIFGKCPRCNAAIKNWVPPAFSVALYDELRAQHIDPLTGHMDYCDQMWVKWLWNGG